MRLRRRWRLRLKATADGKHRRPSTVVGLRWLLSTAVTAVSAFHVSHKAVPMAASKAGIGIDELSRLLGGTTYPIFRVRVLARRGAWTGSHVYVCRLAASSGGRVWLSEYGCGGVRVQSNAGGSASWAGQMVRDVVGAEGFRYGARPG